MSDEAVQDVWNQFMTGQWKYEMNSTYYDNGTTELRFWNFAEMQGPPPIENPEEMAILGSDGKKLSLQNMKKFNRQAKSFSVE